MNSSENHGESLEEANRKEAVASIEAIRTGPEQRAQVVMVLLGLKPAAMLSLYAWNSSLAEVETLLGKTGLKYIRRAVNKHPKTVAEYGISKDEDIAQQLLDCKSPAEFGALMGYPETAIKAFESRDIYKGPLPADIENSIFRMIFSREHHEEEFETIRRWNQALLENAPGLAPR